MANNAPTPPRNGVSELLFSNAQAAKQFAAQHKQNGGNAFVLKLNPQQFLVRHWG